MLVCATVPANAQTNRVIDSLEALAKKQTDVSLINTLTELTWQYRTVNPSKAISFGRQAIALSKGEKYDKGLAQAYNDLGIIYFDLQQFDSALHLYHGSVGIRERQGDELGLARLYNKIGIVHQRQGNFPEALKNQLQALGYFEKLGNDIGISYSLNNIAILYQNMGMLTDALKYQNLSIKIKQKIGDKLGLAGSYVNVGNIHLINKKFGEARGFYTQAVSLSRDLGHKEYLSNALNNLSRLHIETGDFRHALPLVQESLQLRESLQDTKGVVSCLVSLGKIYNGLEQWDSSLLVLNTALQKGKGHASCKPEMPLIYGELAHAYEKKQQFGTALTMHKNLVAYKDSIFNTGMTQQFAELETKYQTEKKERQIALLSKEAAIQMLTIANQTLEMRRNQFENAQNRLRLSNADLELANRAIDLQSKNGIIVRQRHDSLQKEQNLAYLRQQGALKELEWANRELSSSRKNTLLLLLAVFLLLTALLIYSVYRNNQIRQKAAYQKAFAEQQREATKAVIEAEDRERQRIAQDLHDTIGQMMSAAKMNLSALEHRLSSGNADEREQLQKAMSLVDDSCREVRTVSHNMMPNALLKKDLASALEEFLGKLDQRNLQVHLDTTCLKTELDPHVEAVLYRVVQECVNNVVKHAHASTLDISIVCEPSEVSATIEDNGRGFDPRAVNDGIGLQNMRSRIEYLNGSIDYDSAPGRGTVVAIHVPLSAS